MRSSNVVRSGLAPSDPIRPSSAGQESTRAEAWGQLAALLKKQLRTPRHRTNWKLIRQIERGLLEHQLRLARS